ncbi:DUF3309 family protein [Aureimonas mangrovi]|uniref:DUF3309 family protein n=1 Tax=Aureimonas mangrovi TaxID=2758041 RepID=UPI00163D8A48|nr:DUF3309 family protein [Aureimonas mangrovi]
MTLGATLTLLSLAALVAVLPFWPWSREWDYRPAIMLAVFCTFIVVLWAVFII